MRYEFADCTLDTSRFELTRGGAGGPRRAAGVRRARPPHRAPRAGGHQAPTARLGVGGPLRQRVGAVEPAQGGAARRSATTAPASAIIRTVFGRGYQFVASVEVRDAVVAGPGLPPTPAPTPTTRPVSTGRRPTIRRRRPGGGPVLAAHPLLHRGRRRSPRLRHERNRTAAGQGGELDDPPRPRRREPGVGTLAPRACRPHHTPRSVRRAGLRTVGLGRQGLLVRRLGRRPAARRRRRRPRPLPAARHLAGCRRRRRLRGPLPRAGVPPGARSARTAGAAWSGPTTRPQRREAFLDLDIARVGWYRDDPSFRQVFTSQFLPDGSAAAVGGVQRAAAAHDHSRERGRVPHARSG